MSYIILISETAEKQFHSLDNNIRMGIRKSIAFLKSDPFTKKSGADIKKLHGYLRSNRYRLRVGNYRIVYSVINKKVKITEIFHRKKGYAWLD